jgi:hypothetical protein
VWLCAKIAAFKAFRRVLKNKWEFLRLSTPAAFLPWWNELDDLGTMVKSLPRKP